MILIWLGLPPGLEMVERVPEGDELRGTIGPLGEALVKQMRCFDVTDNGREGSACVYRLSTVPHAAIGAWQRCARRMVGETRGNPVLWLVVACDGVSIARIADAWVSR
jgi:hypothetical protein